MARPLRAARHLASVTLKGEFAGLRRLRVGHYRIVYEVISRELVVLVVRIGQGQGVYRQRQR